MPNTEISLQRSDYISKCQKLLREKFSSLHDGNDKWEPKEDSAYIDCAVSGLHPFSEDNMLFIESNVRTSYIDRVRKVGNIAIWGVSNESSRIIIGYFNKDNNMLSLGSLYDVGESYFSDNVFALTELLNSIHNTTNAKTISLLMQVGDQVFRVNKNGYTEATEFNELEAIARRKYIEGHISVYRKQFEALQKEFDMFKSQQHTSFYSFLSRFISSKYPVSFSQGYNDRLITINSHQLHVKGIACGGRYYKLKEPKLYRLKLVIEYRMRIAPVLSVRGRSIYFKDRPFLHNLSNTQLCFGNANASLYETWWDSADSFIDEVMRKIKLFETINPSSMTPHSAHSSFSPILSIVNEVEDNNFTNVILGTEEENVWSTVIPRAPQERVTQQQQESEEEEELPI